MRVSCARFSSHVLNLPGPTNIYRFGAARGPLLRDVNLQMHDGEGWAIVGSGKTTLLEALAGQHRIIPPPPHGIFPFLQSFAPPRDPSTSVHLVSFAYRRNLPSGGAFRDYSARYGAVREEDKLTLRDSIASSAAAGTLDAELLDTLSRKLQLHDKLDLPLVALSNGQTRRSAVLRSLLLEPDVLLLDEPLTGLDVKQRPLLTQLLGDLHQRRQPRIILGLRSHDPIPEWVTHIALASEGTVTSYSKQEIDSVASPRSERRPLTPPQKAVDGSPQNARKSLVEIKGLNISYDGRKVLTDIHWTIREGDRWHLSGPNGSGKTTLLSTITGDHPLSYSQKHLLLFGQHRRRLATSQIQQKIGIVSPEIFSAFPRRWGPEGLSVRDAIATGFEATFSYRPRNPKQEERIDELLAFFSPSFGATFDGAQSFASLSIGHQSLVLFLRALAPKPSLLILDEVFSGMDDGTINLAKQHLREHVGPTQAVVFVSHWDAEVPWTGDELQRMSLES